MWRFLTYVAAFIRNLIGPREREPREREPGERRDVVSSSEAAAPAGIVALALAPDTTWDETKLDPARIDPGLRLAVSLFQAGDFAQLYRRTGIDLRSAREVRGQWLPLFLELGDGGRPVKETLSELQSFGRDGFVLRIAAVHVNEADRNPDLTQVTGGLQLGGDTLAAESVPGYALTLRDRLADIMRVPGVRRLALPAPLQPCLEDALADIELPPGRQLKGTALDGNGVVVGIIDDGCALAHRNFLVPGTTQSRILYLWDQGRTDTVSGLWHAPVDVNEGLELTKADIDAAINQPGFVQNGVIAEDKVYDYLHYDPDLASHGTHVMDIAAGNGTSLLGSAGIASAADIIFVQLPRDRIDEGGPVLEDHILRGAQYVFARAEALGAARGLPGPVPAVVNVSYGGYIGPHDGTSPLAKGMDDLLDGETDRAIVVSAGNGFEADCHARRSVAAGAHAKTLHWLVSAEDPTANWLEIWYEQAGRLELSLTCPGATNPFPPVSLGQSTTIVRQSDGKSVGWISHVATNTGGNRNMIRIHLCPSVGEDDSTLTVTAPATGPSPVDTASAPSGVWKIDLRNSGTVPVELHAWIERDDLGRRGSARRQQSRFAPHDADPRYTLAGLATGRHTICVGAYNSATGEVCRYSASGPTQDERDKPEVCAPAEEDAAGRGILCASSRRAQPTRMNGTSASAPHVTGLVALMLQFNRDEGGAPLSVGAIRSKLVAAAKSAQLLAPPPPRKLRENRHQEVDPHRPNGKRQSDHFDDAIGDGKINVGEALKLLP